MDTDPLYVAGQTMYGRLHLLGDPIKDQKEVERVCEQLVPDGLEMYVVELKVVRVIKGAKR